MTPKNLVLVAAGVAALALPAAAQAQSYWRGYDAPRYTPQGDYYGRLEGYPEFRGLEQHLRREIADRDLPPWQAERFRDELRRIQWQEQREFREHGWRLPDGDRYEIRSRLQQLDARVDRARD